MVRRHPAADATRCLRTHRTSSAMSIEEGQAPQAIGFITQPQFSIDG
jgi:hypothetical protein